MAASYSGQYASQVQKKEAAKARAGSARARRPAELTLSAVLAAAPHLFDGRRVTAVDRGIAAIDSLPERVASQVKVSELLL